ncbi:MAG: GID complex subunit containing RING finger motif [Tremellales sp. Tagirdzhanova-0007]|nr:MAG: GID complex subunit containing RING finger motif [Tremellales sp. Tagirdzhanova-0007]
MPAGPPSSFNGSLLLEEPLIRTPYELLRRSHRSAQRQVEKELSAIQSTLQVLLSSAASETGSSGDWCSNAITKLDFAGERVQGLKRKLDDLQPSGKQSTPLRSRLGYLDQLTGVKSNAGHEETKLKVTGRGEAETDSSLDRYISDYLLRTGRMKAAKALAENRGIEDLVDLKLFSELVRVERALVDRQSVAEALAWCGENRGTLKKIKNNLEFTLRMQEFIELCRKRETAKAITYSRKNLMSWATSHMDELQQGMTLLAFGEKTGVGSYRRLYDRSRWLRVRDQFRETFLNLYALPSQSLLALSLSAGLSSLRVPSCVPHGNLPREPMNPEAPVVALLPAAPPLHNLEAALGLMERDPLIGPIGGPPSSPKDEIHEHPETQVGNVDCPTCNEDIKVLAKEVPMSHHVNSTIVCRISGEVMDSQNEPLAFPNGYALAAMAKNNFDVVTCPRTRESCAFSRLRKVYIS